MVGTAARGEYRGQERDSYATAETSGKDASPKHKPRKTLPFNLKNIKDSALPHLSTTPTGLEYNHNGLQLKEQQVTDYT